MKVSFYKLCLQLKQRLHDTMNQYSFIMRLHVRKWQTGPSLCLNIATAKLMDSAVVVASPMKLITFLQKIYQVM